MRQAGQLDADDAVYSGEGHQGKSGPGGGGNEESSVGKCGNS